MKQTLVALAISAIVGASLSAVATPPAVYADQLQGCADFEFVAVRGSGELSAAADSHWNGIGQTLSTVYSKALKPQLDHLGYTSSRISVDYRAVALGPVEEFEGATTTPGPYTNSVGDGVNKLTQAIGDVQEKCPDSKIILGGYSQGAQVIDETLNMKTHGTYGEIVDQAYVDLENAQYTPVSSETANSIAGVLLFGDPKFNGSDTAVNGSSTADPAHSGVWLLHQKWSSQLDSAATKVVSDCHLADPVCNSREDVVSNGFHYSIADLAWVALAQSQVGDDPVGNSLGLPHSNYFNDATEAVNQLLESMGLPVVSSRTLGIDDDQPTDTAYLVDSRADMWQDDPNNSDDSESANGDGVVSYMDEVAHAIDDQIGQQADRDEDERWALDMYYAAPDALPAAYKQPTFPGYYYEGPGYDTMSTSRDRSAITDQVWNWEKRDGGPAAQGLYPWYADSSDYSDPTSLNWQLLQTANAFAGATPAGTFDLRPFADTDAIAGHRHRIVIITNRPDDLTRSMQVRTTDGGQAETWSLGTTVRYLQQLGVSISFWNPIADPSGAADPSSFRSNSNRSQAAHAPRIETASSAHATPVDDAADSPSSANIATATRGTVVDSADGLNAINAYAARQPVDEITAPVASYTGQPVSATSANTEGDGLDTLNHTDWTVVGPDGSVVDSATTDGGGPLQFTPPSAGSYTIQSTITLQSGYSGSASWTVDVSDAPTTVPDSPSVAATVDANNTVTLAWAPVATSTYYTIRDSDGNVLQRLNPLTDANGNLTWSEALPDQSGGDVSYTVSASNNVGEGELSSPATTTLHDLPPDAPTATGTVDAHNDVTLTWPAEARATSYTVFDVNHNTVAQVDADADSAGNVSWEQSLPNDTGSVTYQVSATGSGGESALSTAVTLVLHNLHPVAANVPDATGSPVYSGDVTSEGVPTDTEAATTTALQSECASGASSNGPPIASGPYAGQTVTAVGAHSILIDVTATNQLLCNLTNAYELPSSGFENLGLAVDPNASNYTFIYDSTASGLSPTSAYLSLGPASDGLTSTRSFSVLMNFDSSFDAGAQATTLQSAMSRGDNSWFISIGVSPNVSWLFADPPSGGGGGGGEAQAS